MKLVVKRWTTLKYARKISLITIDQIDWNSCSSLFLVEYDKHRASEGSSEMFR